MQYQEVLDKLRRKRLREGYEAAKNLVGLYPDCHEARRLLGMAAIRLGNPQQALLSLGQAVQMCPDGAIEKAPCLVNYATALLQAGAYYNALLTCHQAMTYIEQVPAELREDVRGVCMFNAGTALIALEDDETSTEQGWLFYEHRGVTTQRYKTRRRLNPPPSKDAEGTLYLWWDQGNGDAIQFSRYIPELARTWKGKLIIDLPNGLHYLLEPAIRRAAGPEACRMEFCCLAMGEEPEEAWDYDLPISSLRVRYGSNRPDLGEYLSFLRAEKRDWTKPRVGVVMRGHPDHQNDKLRSLDDAKAEDVVCFLRNNCGADVFNCHVLPGTTHGNAGSMTSIGQPIPPIHWLSPLLGLEDADETPWRWNDSANAMGKLDAFVTVDTAAAHIAGSMGIPTFMLVSHGADYRWGRSGVNSPETSWYPSMRVYRQQKLSEWDQPIGSLLYDIQTFLAALSAPGEEG